MRHLCMTMIGLVLWLGLGTAPAAAQTTITGGSDLLSQTQANQLGAWLGEGAITINRIYTKSQGLHNSLHFHSDVDDRGRTFSLIEIDPDGDGVLPTRLVGGYNPFNWTSSGNYRLTPADADRTAFIFNLSIGYKLDQKKSTDPDGNLGAFQTYNHSSNGPSFGVGQDINVDNTLNAGYLEPGSYGPGVGPSGINIYGGSDGGQAVGVIARLTVRRIEVFTITGSETTPAVPEPSAIWLFLPALGVLTAAYRKNLRQ